MRGLDLTGVKAYDWEVLEYAGNLKWKCRCSCGAIRYVRGADIKSGKSKSCGHGNNAFNDLTGKKFGEWTVLEYAGNRYWKCKCSCGTVKNVRYSNLIYGKSKSCGCKYKVKVEDIVGKRFGNLVVLEFESKEGYGIKYKCRCDCGNTISVYRSNLMSGGTKSCGCNFYINGAITRQNNGNTKHRTIDKIQITASRDNFLDYIKSLGYMPTVSQLMEQLSLSQSGILWLIDKYDIKEFIDLKPKVSSYEDEIYNHVRDKFPDLEIIRSNRKILNGKELDIYIPEKQIALEFNGSYWHSDIYKDAGYHQNKFMECGKRRIRLINIFEYEWVDKTVQSKILNLIDRVLSNNCNIVYARKCDIAETSSKEAVEFYNKYHMHGGVNSKVNIILRYEGNIVGAMSFSKPRFTDKVQWEVTRLCFDESTNVVGGTERMFKYFIRKYKPKSIVAYCDISKFVGNTYLRLGMKLDCICKPNYVWVDAHNNVVTRYRAQKHKLIEMGIATESDTECSAMTDAGYTKVYDCGNLRFVWPNNIVEN